MVAAPKPRKVKVLGKESWWLVPAVADVLVPKITEINAVTGFNFSCSLLPFEGIQPAFGKIELPAYMCETETYEDNDTIKWSMPDMEGGFDPQATVAHNDKKAFEFLRNPFSGFAISRPGVDADGPAPEATVGQFFNVVPVNVTRAVPTKSGTDNSAIFTWKAGIAVTGKPGLIVAAVAGP